MTNQSKYPGTTGFSGLGQTWNNRDNVKVLDGSFSHAVFPGSYSATHRLEVTNFSFTVPAGATMTGVRAHLYRRYTNPGSAPDINLDGAKLIIAGSATGDDKAGGSNVAWSTSFTWDIYGGKTNLWGTALTQAQAVASNFGLEFWCRGKDCHVEIDAIMMEVWYTPSGYAPQALLTGHTMPDNSILLGEQRWQSIGG